MAIILRDAQPTIIHCDEDVLRAVVGIGELFSRPSVTLKACYAIPTTSDSTTDPSNIASSSSDRSTWVVGKALEERESIGGNDWEVRWPFRCGNNGKDREDWEGREYILAHLYTLLNLNIQTNTSPLLLIPPPHPGLSLPTQELYTLLAFEQLNVPALSLLPTPLSTQFALNSTTGLTIQVGPTSTRIDVIIDSIVRWECGVNVDIGIQDCERWLEGLVGDDEGVDREFRAAAGKGEGEGWGVGEKERLVKELCGVIWECTADGDVVVSGVRDGLGAAVMAAAVAVPEEAETFDVAKKLVGDPAPVPTAQSHKSKKAQQAQQAQQAANKAAADAIAADVVVLTLSSLPDKEITLGPVRHRLCEPLFKGKGNGGETIWEGVGRAVEAGSLRDWEKKAVWEGIGVIGELAKFRSFGPALLSYLTPFLLASPETSSPEAVQPSKVRLLSIPSYFANFERSTTELAPFLGGSMVAKMAFSEVAGKHCITKVDYNAKGPAAIHITSIAAAE